MNAALLNMENALHRLEGVAEIISIMSTCPDFEDGADEALRELSTDLMGIYRELISDWKVFFQASSAFSRVDNCP